MAVISRVPVYCDLSRGCFVGGKQNKGIENYPLGRNVFSQSNLKLLVYPLTSDPDGTTLAPFQAVPPSGLALTAAIVKSGGTVLATGSSFTADDSAGTLAGSLNLNTVAMATEFSSATSVSAIVEFRFTGDFGEQSVRQNITILKQLVTSGTPAAIGAAVYLTRDEIMALFVAKDGAAGDSITLRSPDGTKALEIYLDDNGTKHEDPA